MAEERLLRGLQWQLPNDLTAPGLAPAGQDPTLRTRLRRLVTGHSLSARVA